MGSGGREHALAHVLARTADVVVTPGNPGMAAPITVTAAPPAEIEADLFVIGPEAPLVDGLADRLRAGGRRVMGPGADGARLEGSKAFMKQVLAEAGVPTARFADFGAAERAEAVAYLDTLPGPWVVKTDGLAAGKGVLVAATLEEARADVEAKLSGAAFGEAGRRIVIEEGLAGEECSLLVLYDGNTAVPLLPAQDFKRIGDGDRGPNTGGMGAYAPMPHVPPAQVDEIMATAVEPLVAALVRRGIDYRGVLYAGLMLGDDGPRVIEYNVRFGDPEAQALLPRLRSDLLPALLAACDGELANFQLMQRDVACVSVVLAARGYPGTYARGGVIGGLDRAAATPHVAVFHAGTDVRDGQVVANGGRVLTVCGTGETLQAARDAAYAGVAAIDWSDSMFRTDIGLRSIKAALAGLQSA